MSIAMFTNDPTNSVTETEWTNLYTGINYANQCIDNIPNVPDDDSKLGDVKKQALAEARFLRAYYYYRLYLNFGENVPIYTHVRDFEVVTDLDDDYKNAQLKLFVEAGCAPKTNIKNSEVEVSLLDMQGNSLYQERKTLKAGKEVAFDKKIDSPHLWSAEKPNLYRLLLTLRTNGKAEQYISRFIGFRKSEIKHGRLCVDICCRTIRRQAETYQHLILLFLSSGRSKFLH